MAMSDRSRAVVALLLALSRPACAATDPYAGILNGPATRAKVNEASRLAGGCGSEECAAVRDVARAFMTILRRDVPGTMAHVPQPADPTQAADQALQGELLAHRSRYSNYCEILTKLASHYSEYFLGHASVEIANRIDAAGGRCTANVLAAFPKTAEVSRMVDDARETCRSDGRKGCDRDVLK